MPKKTSTKPTSTNLTPAASQTSQPKPTPEGPQRLTVGQCMNMAEATVVGSLWQLVNDAWKFCIDKVQEKEEAGWTVVYGEKQLRQFFGEEGARWFQDAERKGTLDGDGGLPFTPQSLCSLVAQSVQRYVDVLVERRVVSDLKWRSLLSLPTSPDTWKEVADWLKDMRTEAESVDFALAQPTTEGAKANTPNTAADGPARANPTVILGVLRELKQAVKEQIRRVPSSSVKSPFGGQIDGETQELFDGLHGGALDADAQERLDGLSAEEQELFDAEAGSPAPEAWVQGQERIAGLFGELNRLGHYVDDEWFAAHLFGQLKSNFGFDPETGRSTLIMWRDTTELSQLNRRVGYAIRRLTDGPAQGGQAAPAISDDTFLSAPEGARLLRIPRRKQNAFAKQCERWRRRNKGHVDFVLDNCKQGSRGAQYRYRLKRLRELSKDSC